MVRGNACDHLRGLVSRINSLCGLVELTVVRVQIGAADLEESLDRDADKMLSENHPLRLPSAEGEVRIEPRAVVRGGGVFGRRLVYLVPLGTPPISYSVTG